MHVIILIVAVVLLLLYLVLEPILNQERKAPLISLQSTSNLPALKDLPKTYGDIEPKHALTEEPEKPEEAEPPAPIPPEPKPVEPQPAPVVLITETKSFKPVKKEPTEWEKAVKEGRGSVIGVPGFKPVKRQVEKDERSIKVAVRKPGSKYLIQAGTTVPAITVSAINSDLPGHVVARITRNIYDSVGGRSLLLPQGSLILGQYGSDIKMNQRRVGVFWNEIKLPNGSTIKLGKGMPGTGNQGMSGLTGDIDNHYGNIAFSVFTTALLNSTANHISNSNSGSLRDDVSEDVAGDVADAGSDLIKNQLQLKPTIKIPIGSTVKILITKDLLFEAPYEAR